MERMEETRGLVCSHSTSRGAPCTSTTTTGVRVRLATACARRRHDMQVLDGKHQQCHVRSPIPKQPGSAPTWMTLSCRPGRVRSRRSMPSDSTTGEKEE